MMANPSNRTEASPVAMESVPQSYKSLPNPFYATKLPAGVTLPTTGEILASTDILPCIFNNRWIRRVGQHFIVKHGDVKLDEAQNMQFVAEHSSGKVIVPKLYAAYYDEKEDSNFIVMERLEGKSLEDEWDELRKEGRNSLAKKLKVMFDAIRAISSQGYYGRLHHQPFDDIFIGSKTQPCGPFTTQSEINTAFYQRYKSLHPDFAAGRGEFYCDVVFPKVMKGHPPVFTHGDLQAKNIMIREDGEPCIIDWECSAWYPSYHEYSNALWTSRRWKYDWFRFLGEFLDKFVVEFKCMENLLPDLLDAPQPGVEIVGGTGRDSKAEDIL